MERTRITLAMDNAMIGQKVQLNGWLRTKRESKGGFSFLEINDGSSLSNIQIIADNTLSNYEDVIRKLTTGCSLTVTGILHPSPGKGQLVELHAESIEVLGQADSSFPIQKKRHSLEYLREMAHLRTRTNTFGALARIRNSLSWAIHSFFQSRGFLYLHTPIITTSDCEGAGSLFHVTTLDLNQLPLETTKTDPETRNESSLIPDKQVDFSKDFFGCEAHLTVSGQLQGESYACSLGDIYTFGPTFRAENSNTTRHLAEFWMVEPEMAFCDLVGNMDLAEEFLKSIISQVITQCPEDMTLFHRFIEPGILDTLNHVIDQDFVRLPYTEAIEILEKTTTPFEFPVKWGCDLQSEHERFLTEQHFHSPVILFDYPAEIKPFYMRVNDDRKTVRACDVLVPKVGELIGGSQREERYDVLINRMQKQSVDPKDYQWYLDLRKWGTVPHSGFGLGLERVVQFITGMANIRDCIPFPRTPGNAAF